MHLETAELARALDTSTRNVGRWRTGAATPRLDARERLLELLTVLDGLSEILSTEVAHDWLFTPNAAFDHYKPVDLISRGEYREVLSAIDAIADGVFV